MSATVTRRRPGRPRKHPAPEQLEQLPTFEPPTSDTFDTAEALEALTAADSAPDAGDSPQAPETAHGPKADTSRDRSATVAPSSGVRPAPPAKLPAGRSALNGKQYRGLKLEQLRTIAAERDNQLAELRQQIAAMAPAAAAANEAMVSAAIGGTLGIFTDTLALFFGDAARLTPEQRSTLGEVWAPVIGPRLGEAIANVPLYYAVTQTGGILFEKVMTVRAERMLAAAETVHGATA